MAWAKRKAMTWEWYQFKVAEDDAALKLAELAAARHKISFVLPTLVPSNRAVSDEEWRALGCPRVIMNPGVLIITCKGTPVPTIKKTKEASE